MADYNKAIQLDPNYTAAYTNRGSAYADQGNLAAALADYTKAIQLDPNNAASCNNRGKVYTDQGNLVAAIADFHYYLELQPNAVNKFQVEMTIFKLEAELAKQK